MKSEVVEFLLKEAEICQYKTMDYIQTKIEYNTTEEKYTIEHQIASVYGFWIKLDKEKKKEVFEDTECGEVHLIRDNWYPLYWGKDIYAGSRMDAHIAEPEGTGTMGLSKYNSLKDGEIISGGVLVEFKKYEGFEKYLHENYKPILGSSKKGKSANR